MVTHPTNHAGAPKSGAFLAAPLALAASGALAAPLAGGTLDPLTIPKYVTPLVIPPVMNDTGTPNDYDIAVRQFQQQILPGGIWDTLSGRTDGFPATTVFSYGPDADPMPDSSSLGGGAGIAPAANSQFNYPAYTVEAAVDTDTTVDWMNELVVDAVACKNSTTPATDPACNFVPHITPVDRSLHWANPELLTCGDGAAHTDCRPDPINGLILQDPYLGPVPIVTHLHGAHVGPESDGYPEAWWLPDANNIPAGYATQGKLVNQYVDCVANPADPKCTNKLPGVASFSYPNTQLSTTLWYHDHTLGMTRNNVYAGPAGFWLIRDGSPSAQGRETGLAKKDANHKSQVLPGPAPVAGQAVLDLNDPTPSNPVRFGIREIPVVIQDRSFNADGSLFYPSTRAFFQEVRQNQVKIPFIGDPTAPSDISAIWNPEAFFNTMVANGVTWPSLRVAQAEYRFRLLNGCNSRFLNLSMFVVTGPGPDGISGTADDVLGAEVPFYQIGADQGLMPNVVKVETGFKTALPGDGTVPAATAAAAPEEALLMGLAERADVIVDFSGLPNGTRVRMINTGPDAPFGGFPAAPIADPSTTGQVMEFVIDGTLNGKSPTDPTGATPATAPQDLVLRLPDPKDRANVAGTIGTPRDLALIEEESTLVCVTVQPNGVVSWDSNAMPDANNPGTCISQNGNLAMSVPMAPKAAVLGINGASGGSVTLWSALIETAPALNSSETWELWNWTVDAHPIHVHLVKYKVINRECFDDTVCPGGTPALNVKRPPAPTEAGWKDTVIAYPGEVTRFNATFDIPGLYVWHCHIVEHEDNEMMVPFCVGDRNANGCQVAGVDPLVP